MTEWVALSTAKAEFNAAVEGLKTGPYLKNLNIKIFKQKFCLLLYRDNRSCIRWQKNPIVYHAKTKHIDICYHFTRELYNGNFFELLYVLKSNQLGVKLTKYLSVTIHESLMEDIIASRLQVECRLPPERIEAVQD